MIVNVSLKLICKEKMQKIHNFRISVLYCECLIQHGLKNEMVLWAVKI